MATVASTLDQLEVAMTNGPPPTRVGVRTIFRSSSWWLLATTYALGAIILYWHFPALSHDRIPLAPVGDQVQQVWFLAWPAHAIAHFENPFISNFLNFPPGVNLVTNTAMLALGVLFAPLTWLAGPLATYVVLLQLGFFASALSGAWCARRLGASWWGSWLAGAIFGFGAHRVVEGSIHVFMALDVVAPLVLIAVVRLVERRWTTRRFALTTGLLLTFEFLISSELFAIIVVTLVLIAVVLLVASRRRDAVVALLRAYATAAALTLILLAVPIWYFLWGPQSISGAPHHGVAWADTTLGSLLRPGTYALWAPLGRTTSQLSLLQGPWVNATYLGAPLLALAAIGWWRSRRERLINVVGIVTVLLLVGSFGSSFHLPGVHWSIPSPYRIIDSLPVLQDVLPSRFMELVLLGVALLAARAVGQSSTPASLKSNVPKSASRQFLSVTTAALAILTVVTLIPNQLVAASGTSTLPWLNSAEARTALPTNSVVLSYPYPYVIFNTPMLDQASSGVRYKLIGGQAIVPQPNGRNLGVWPLTPRVVFDIFFRSASQYPNAPVRSLPFAVGSLPPNNSATWQQFHLFVKRNHVDEIFFRQWGYHPEIALAYLRGAFGPGRSFAAGTVYVWNLHEPTLSSAQPIAAH